MSSFSYKATSNTFIQPFIQPGIKLLSSHCFQQRECDEAVVHEVRGERTRREDRVHGRGAGLGDDGQGPGNPQHVHHLLPWQVEHHHCSCFSVTQPNQIRITVFFLFVHFFFDLINFVQFPWAIDWVFVGDPQQSDPPAGHSFDGVANMQISKIQVSSGV